MTTPGTPGIEKPARCKSPSSSASSYQMLGLRAGRCGSPASSGLPVLVLGPASAQQFEPAPSAALLRMPRSDSVPGLSLLCERYGATIDHALGSYATPRSAGSGMSVATASGPSRVAMFA